MTAFIFCVIFATSWGRLEYLEVHGPATPTGELWNKALCDIARDDYIGTVTNSTTWSRTVTPCIGIISQLPRCE